MAKFINQPSIVAAEGNLPKKIEEFVGNVNSQTNEVSIAKMNSPKGWIEPGQTPDFSEYTVVLSGELQVKTKSETFHVKAGQAIIVQAGEWAQYSTPNEYAEYIAVCLPAFAPHLAHRDE